MSDPDFERRVAAVLHAPVPPSEGARERIMARVRHAALASAPRRRPRSLVARQARHSIVGLAMAASIGSMAVLSTVTPHRSLVEGHSSVIGDSLVSTLRDTLRLMRLMRDTDHRYAFVVDGARWAPDPAATPVRADDRLVSLLRATRDSN